MSQFDDLKSYALGSHNWFFPEGAAITSPGAGVVAIDNWPDSLEPTFDSRFIGDTEDWSHKKTVEEEEVFKADPGVLVRKDIVTFFQKLDLEITTNSLRRIAMQILYGSDTELTEAVAEFEPLSAPPPNGLWIARKYTQQNECVFLMNCWCRVNVSETASGNKKLVKPKFEVKILSATGNIIRFGKPEVVEA